MLRYAVPFVILAGIPCAAETHNIVVMTKLLTSLARLTNHCVATGGGVGRRCRRIGNRAG